MQLTQTRPGLDLVGMWRTGSIKTTVLIREKELYGVYNINSCWPRVSWIVDIRLES